MEAPIASSELSIERSECSHHFVANVYMPTQVMMENMLENQDICRLVQLYAQKHRNDVVLPINVKRDVRPENATMCHSGEPGLTEYFVV